jgi:putative transposase
MTRGGGSAEPGVVYHLISRFVAKEWFIKSEGERRMYLSLLGGALATTDWTCFSFAVMSSHVHLGLVAGSDRLATWLRPMHTTFANWLNVERERIGAVFVRGPNLGTVPPDQCARLVNYIHYNPVRAGVVADPKQSDWTSHPAYVGAGRAPTWLAVDAGLALCGFSSGADFECWSSCNQVSRDSLIASGVMPRLGRGRPPGASAGAQQPSASSFDSSGPKPA